MCIRCLAGRLPRRHFLGLAGAAGLLPAAARAHDEPMSAITGAQAIEKLKAGNARFVANAELCAAELTQHRQAVAAAQAPFAIVLSCSDSRVPPELVFGGLGLGELFVARNAGGVVDSAELGTLEYGAEHLGSPLIVVLGHQRCGAVSAACEVVTKNTDFPGAVETMIEPIIPAALAVRSAPGDFITNTVKESARRTAAHLPDHSSLLAHRVAEGRLTIVSAYYELDSGRVTFAA